MDSPLGCFCLATELIVMIFKEIHNVHDAIMLGLTHDTLMLIGWNHIRSLLLQDSAPWAGSRIICVGEYTETLPEGFLSDEEAEELRRLNGPPSDGRINEINLLNFRDHYDSLNNHVHMPYERLWGLSWEERRVFSQIIDGTSYEWENGWVLMNLSTMEYVTSKVASRILFINPTDGCCFGQLILARICWSSDGGTAMRFDGPLHQGVWAGDRFRIVTTDVFKARTSDGEGWEDVSVEAAKWLRDILRSDGADRRYSRADIGNSDEEAEESKDEKSKDGV